MKSLVLKNKIEELPQLEAFVEELADEYALDPALCFNLNLVLEELATNVALYAFPKDEEHDFLITADKNDGNLVLHIVDDGVPFNPVEEAPEVDVTLGAEDREIGGLGIFLVQQLMDKVEYERTDDGKNSLTIIKKVD